VPLGIAALLAAGSARGDATPPPVDEWRFGVGVAGAWTETVASGRVEGTALVDLGPLGPVFLIPVSSSADLELDGFGLDLSLRAWLPLTVLRGQPWLEAGYRPLFGPPSDGLAGAALGVPLPGYQIGALSLTARRTATVRLGADWILPVAGRYVVAAPVVGADFTWIEAEAFPGSALDGNRETDVAGGVAAGLELRAPLLRGRSYAAEFGVQTTWTGFVAERRSVAFPSGTAFGTTASYELDYAIAVRFGLLVSAW
jgi:hypothetical protein